MTETHSKEFLEAVFTLRWAQEEDYHLRKIRAYQNGPFPSEIPAKMIRDRLSTLRQYIDEAQETIERLKE